MTTLSLVSEGMIKPLQYQYGDTPESFDPVDYFLPCVEVTSDQHAGRPAILVRLYNVEYGEGMMTLEEAARVHAALGDLLRARGAV